MEKNQLLRKTKRFGRRRIAFASILAMVLVFTMMLLMDQKQATQVNASETKEQLSAMQDDLERMSQVLQISRDTVEDVTNEYGGGEFIFSADESSLEQTEQDISITKEEISELIRQIDEGNVTNLTENYESIQNHFSTLEGDVDASVKEIETLISELSKEEKANGKNSIAELNDVKESISSFSEEMKSANGEMAKLSSDGTKEVKSSVDEVSKSVGEVSNSVSDVSKSVSGVSNSISELSKNVSNQMTQNTETILRETSTAFADNKDAINQNTDARAEEIKDEIKGNALTLADIQNEIKEKWESVFQFVSDGKKAIATALLTNGFTVANKDGKTLDPKYNDNGDLVVGDEAADFTFEDYKNAINDGMKGLYAKMDEIVKDSSKTYDSIDDLIQGGGLQDIYQKGYDQGKDVGLKEGEEKGKSAPKKIWLTTCAEAGLTIRELGQEVYASFGGMNGDEIKLTTNLYQVENHTGYQVIIASGEAMNVVGDTSQAKIKSCTPNVVFVSRNANASSVDLIYLPDGESITFTRWYEVPSVQNMSAIVLM